MSKRYAILFVALLLLSFGVEAKKRVRIKYKSHTQLDFSGNKVRGKIKAPAVFYIFQRKRSKGRRVAEAPKYFLEHKHMTKDLIEETLNK